MTTYRGAQVRFDRTSDEVVALVQAGAKLIRFPISDVFEDTAGWNEDDYLVYLEEELEKLSDLLPFLGQAKAVLNMAIVPPTRQIFLAMWKFAAQWFKDDDRVFVYGVLNEPRGTKAYVTKLMQDTYKVIRKITRYKRIAVSGVGSDPSKFQTTPYFKNDPYVWYEFHMYSPIAITHQGVNGATYPKVYPATNANKTRMYNDLKKVRAFQKLHKGCKIFVGEFSISTFAGETSRVNYLTDCVNIFKEYGFHWTYHAWRENPISQSVWNAENDPAVLVVLTKGWK